jgi:hypothetical protein
VLGKLDLGAAELGERQVGNPEFHRQNPSTTEMCVARIVGAAPSAAIFACAAGTDVDGSRWPWPPRGLEIRTGRPR